MSMKDEVVFRAKMGAAFRSSHADRVKSIAELILIKMGWKSDEFHCGSGSPDGEYVTAVVEVPGDMSGAPRMDFTFSAKPTDDNGTVEVKFNDAPSKIDLASDYIEALLKGASDAMITGKKK